LEDFGVEIIADICNVIYITGYIQHDLKTSIFIAWPNMTAAVVSSDFKTISIMNHITKILLKVIPERIQNKINIELQN
jgi:hypothetical protein